MIDNVFGKLRRVIPTPIFKFFNPAYHWTLALLAAIWYRFPANKIKVIAITGTKGKSSTVEILNAILEKAGHKTALSNTIRYKVGDLSSRNLYKMSMPGRGFGQRLLRQAVKAGCEYMIMEMTSQGAMLFRHRFIALDALIFTNITPEHLDSHGSYENYLYSKLAIGENMVRSDKRPRVIIANSDDKESAKFLDLPLEIKLPYNVQDLVPYKIEKEGLEFNLAGKKVHSQLSGLFNLYNISAAVTAARQFGIPDQVIVTAVESLAIIPGRLEKIRSAKGFEVVVDYAHTPDSLEKFYRVFKKDVLSDLSPSSKISVKPKNICILGGTGGGRDVWKRKEMGRLADNYCQEIILTDEDPYDEDPDKIVADVASGISKHKPLIIMDRRLAIREALKRAKANDSVLITGKGTDPYIMGPDGEKTPWSDSQVVREELERISPVI